MSSEAQTRRAGSGGKAQGGSLVQQKLRKLGLERPEDFIVHLPLRYEDETRVTPIADALPGMAVQVEGVITHSHVQPRPRRQLLATVQDASGSLGLRWLHFYPNQLAQLQSGNPLRVRGEVRAGFTGPEIIHPRVTRADQPLADALTPVYPSTDGLAQPVLRKAIARALDVADLSDTLPEPVRDTLGLMPFGQAIRLLHSPPPDVSLGTLLEKGHPAWQRIKFDELLAQQLSLARARAQRRRQRARRLEVQENRLGSAVLKHLPFSLTAAQQRVVKEIIHDMGRGFPMHRLLQGDVGSGKTVVAALAAAHAIDAGAQVAIMAPTEILAEQHYRKLVSWLEPAGVKVGWLVGSQGVRERREVLAQLADGTIAMAVGTQALIQEKVVFHHLGLVIMDEQHRFGVGQRLELNRKGESADDGSLTVPHQLTMSATPIPRTLAMTFFADLDVSAIDELPPGRTPVRTKLIADTRRPQVLASVSQEVARGRQVYWVCPLVEESEALQLQTAVDTFEHLKASLPDARVGLVHGKLPSRDKQQVMDAFRRGDVDVLVATTVIEVGVDVPNATLMIIEHAERFGLAQLHQLRGRVGRGAAESVCVLLYQEPLSMIARQRLRAMYETTDGFEIARRDLDLRGPGEFLGLRQSGQQLLRFASLETDQDLVEQARELAITLERDWPSNVEAHLQRWMRHRQDYLRS